LRIQGANFNWQTLSNYVGTYYMQHQYAFGA